MFSLTNFAVCGFILPVLFPVFYRMQFKNRVTNTVMLTTRVHSTRVAGGTHQTSMWSPLTSKDLSPPWHQGVEDIEVKCLKLEVENLLDVSLPILKGFKQIKVTGPPAANQTEIMDRPPYARLLSQPSPRFM